MTNPLLLNARALTNSLVNSTGGLYPATLTKEVSGAIDPNDPLNPSTSSRKNYPCQGFRRKSLRKFEGSLIEDDESIVVLIGGSLPDGISPSVNDSFEIGGERFRIVEVAGDSTQSVYNLKVKIS